MRHRTARQGTEPAVAVHFKIERLSLTGYSTAERERFTRSLRSHLSVLAQETDQRSWSQARESPIERVDAGWLPRGATPETAARQIARRILDGLGQEQEASRVKSRPSAPV
jgi:hypothetical protein